MGEVSAQGLASSDWQSKHASIKVFFFNKKDKKYLFVEPEDLYTYVLEPWAFENDECMEYDGYSVTGMSPHWQYSLGAK